MPGQQVAEGGGHGVSVVQRNVVGLHGPAPRLLARFPVILTSRPREHHDDPVRTTLTLDSRDVAEALAREMRRNGRGLKAAVNEALRRGLRLTGPAPRPPRFKVEPHAFGVRAGLDLDRMNQLVDELDARAAARKLGV